jgi:hypothetical protein
VAKASARGLDRKGVPMEFDKLRALRMEDKPALQAFEELQVQQQDNPLAFMDNWSAPWREESLDHYLNLGWSMGHFESAKVQGYVLVQPVLFFKGHTQSLWVESVRASNDIAKEKHLQQVFFHQTLFQDFESQTKGFKIESHSEFNFIKTTKWQN